jgi:aspartyl/glutamyl-tRNA(Asn/Gln) amidotransferase C subunit
MIKVTADVIDECATNLLFKISPEERDVTLEEFDAILTQMSFLGKIADIDKAEPLTFPVKDVHYELREDTPVQPMPAEEELKMAPSRLGNQIRLPKVVG